MQRDGGSRMTNIETAVKAMLYGIGEDPEREGLRDTPRRVSKAWERWTSGYDVSPGSVLTSFEDGAESYNEMVLIRRAPFYSHCEHHLAPFFGTVDIAYIPNKRIVGLSKLIRLIDIYALRLQVQERLTTQIVEAMWQFLMPRGAAVSIRARHLCMESRGIAKQGHETITTALRGVFFSDEKARAEFLSSVKD